MDKSIKKHAKRRGDISFDGIQSLTQASDMPTTSIRRLIKQGVPLPTPEQVGAVYGDFTSAQDYQTMLDTVIKAQAAFDELPSGVRDRFKNDPAELIDFVQDNDNYEEALELGLVSKNIPLDQDKNIKKALDEGEPKRTRKTTQKTTENSPENSSKNEG